MKFSIGWKFSISFGGSVASSIYGINLLSSSVDLAVDLPCDLVDTFVSEVQAEFYADRDTIQEALVQGRPFTVIHLTSAYKFDLFPLLADPFSRAQFGRRASKEIQFDGEFIEFCVATAEDIILNKLRWYRSGGESSEDQWSDVLGIVQVRGEELDREYLSKWAEYLKVSDLLEKLLGSVY